MGTTAPKPNEQPECDLLDRRGVIGTMHLHDEDLS